ncbi:MAG: nucleotide exchange factor GrpE [Rickettsiales bacterium]|jgi:molecular chaperone GrpE|nr:nucleotide exchange factor GrpE [Rickettsiales bacterium]
MKNETIDIIETPETENDCETQIAELNDRILRLAAEVENTRRRAGIDTGNAVRAARVSSAEKILPLIDAIDAAAKIAPDDAGIQTMAAAAAGALSSLDITRIQTIGETLNPEIHNAVSVVQATGNQPPATIADELQSGYMLGDAVLRPAMVIVTK